MQNGTELDVIEPSSRSTLSPLYREPDAESTGSKLERNITANSSDGKKRGKWQVTAILTALFVRHTIHSINIAQPARLSMAIVYCFKLYVTYASIAQTDVFSFRFSSLH